MQNENRLVAAASAPTIATRAQTDDTISAMLFNSASLLPPTLLFNPAVIASTPTVPPSPPITYTQDDIELAEADEAIAAAIAEKAKKRATVKTREHLAIRTRLAAMRSTYAAREKAEKAARLKSLIEQRKAFDLTRQKSEDIMASKDSSTDHVHAHRVITDADRVALAAYDRGTKPNEPTPPGMMNSVATHGTRWHADNAAYNIRRAYMFANRLALLQAQGSVEYHSAMDLQRALLEAGKSAKIVLNSPEVIQEDDFLDQ